MAIQDNSTARSPTVGDVVAGRFRVTGVVGKGAMGSVFAAEHVSTGQAVALKFMLIGEDDGDEFVNRFEQEARVMASLRHPNTIRIYDFGRTDDGAMFMAMELLHGQPLDKMIRDNTRRGATMSEAEAAGIVIQVCKSLAEAHGHGLVHRDLKPGNLFLADDGSGDTLVKVLDFGIARVHDSAMTNAGRILGTPSYMSPEQWQGMKVDARADLYAVGCLLYCCVTGQPPYSAGENILSLLHKHCQDAIPDPRALSKQPLSDAFVQVVTTALAKVPDDRYADARAMRAALEALVGGAWAGTPSNQVSPATDPYARSLAPTKLRELDPDATVARTPVVAERSLPMVAMTSMPGKSKSRLWIGVALGAVAAIGSALWWSAHTPAAVPPTAVVAGLAPAQVESAPALPAPAPVAASPAPVAAVPVPVAVVPAAPPVSAVVAPAPVAAAPAVEPGRIAVEPAQAAAEKTAARPARSPAADKPARRKADAPKLQMVD